MSLTLDEFRRTRPIAQRETTPEVRAIAQEAVRLTALTGHESWEWYNRFLEAAIKAARRQLAQQTAVLESPFATDEDIRMARTRVILIQARIEALTEVLMLPKFLVENAEKARKQIVEMERDAA